MKKIKNKTESESSISTTSRTAVESDPTVPSSRNIEQEECNEKGIYTFQRYEPIQKEGLRPNEEL